MISRANPRLSWGQRERALLSVKRSIHLLSVRMTNEDGATPTVGLLLLAAGASRRLGTPKQLLSYKGESLLRRAARTALASLCRPVVVVTGAHRESVESEIADLPLEIVFNEEWAMGMGASIRAGMEYLTARTDTHAVVVMLCDQPRVEARIINELVAAYRATNAPLVTAKIRRHAWRPRAFRPKTLSGTARAHGFARSKKSYSRPLRAPLGSPHAGGCLRR